MKNTPLPWRIGDGGFTLFGPPNGNPSPLVVCSLKNRDDIKLIVRAVNAHEELLAALKEIAKGAGPFSRDPMEHANNTIEAMKELAQEAIAKAEGKRS